MNKEVEVTGLSMAATAGDGLEISLGAMGDYKADADENTYKISTDAPGANDVSWRSSFRISDYYTAVGLLKPASSNVATTLWTIGDNDAFSGGHQVQGSATVTALKMSDSAQLDLQPNTVHPDKYGNTDSFGNNSIATIKKDNLKYGKVEVSAAAGDKYTADEERNGRGYYIDIPMWIRTNTPSETQIRGTVTITDKTPHNSAEDNKDLLQNAVRVAIIPVGQYNESSKFGDWNSEGKPSLLSSSSIKSKTDAADVVNTITPQTDLNQAAHIFGLRAPTTDANNILGTKDVIWPSYHEKTANTNPKAISKIPATSPTAETYNDALGAVANGTLVDAFGLSVATGNNDNDAPSTWESSWWSVVSSVDSAKKNSEIYKTNVFTIPTPNTSSDYAEVGFIVRVWLEGESIYCEDATAGQDWNIDLHFEKDANLS